MTRQPQGPFLTVLLALLVAAGPLATDMYLPSLPAIADEFGTTIARTQLTLSGFLIGFAAGQLIYGPLSDRYGRKPVLLAGLALFLISTAGCAFAGSVEALIGLRMVQALGAAAPVVLARAVARDLFEGPAAARMLSQMGAIMGLVPAAAPVAGSLFHEAFGWRSVFIGIFIYALTAALLVWRALPETLRTPDPRPISPLSIATTYLELLRNPIYRRFVAACCLTFGGLFAFISGSSFVLQGTFAMSSMGFALAFATAVMGYIGGTLTAARFVVRLGIERTVAIGAVLLAMSGLFMVVLMGAGLFGFAGLLVPMVLYLFGVGLVLPQALAGALTPFPQLAGAASSLLGFMQMTSAAVVGAFVGHMLAYGPMALPVTIAFLGTAALLLSWRARWGGEAEDGL